MQDTTLVRSGPWSRIAPFALILLLTLLANLPWLVGWLNTPADSIYTGYVGGKEDYWSYLTKLRQGWEGSWTWTNLYSPLGEARWFLYPFYLGLGQLTRLLGGDWTHLPLAFHLSAMVLTPPVLGLIWRVARQVVPTGPGRLLALTLALAASAGTVMAVVLNDEATIQYLDTYPAPHAHLAAILYPHYLINLGAMLGAFLTLLDHMERPRWWRPFLGAVLIGAISLVHPHVAASTTFIMGAYALTVPGATRWRALGYAVVAGAGALPYGLYLLSVVSHPELVAWRSVAVQSPPEWYLQPFWVGLAVPLAALTFRNAYREGGGARLLVTWLASAYLLSNLNLPMTAGGSELLMGLSIPAGLLAGRFLSTRSLPWRVGLSAVMLAGALFVLSILTLDAATAPGTDPEQAYYLPKTVVTDVLDAATTMQDGSLLAFGALMPKAPWMAGVRVVYGHHSESPGGHETKERARAACAGELLPSEYEAFLQEFKVQATVQTFPPYGCAQAQTAEEAKP